MGYILVIFFIFLLIDNHITDCQLMASQAKYRQTLALLGRSYLDGEQ